MKHLIVKISIIALSIFCFVFFTNDVMAQSAKQKNQQSFSTKDIVKQYQVQIEAEGEYEVVVIDPKGQTIARPIESTRQMKGSTINFEVNSKYWTPGLYTILTKSKAGVANVQRFRIMPYGM